MAPDREDPLSHQLVVDLEHQFPYYLTQNQNRCKIKASTQTKYGRTEFARRLCSSCERVEWHMEISKYEPTYSGNAEILDPRFTKISFLIPGTHMEEFAVVQTTAGKEYNLPVQQDLITGTVEGAPQVLKFRVKEEVITIHLEVPHHWQMFVTSMINSEYIETSFGASSCHIEYPVCRFSLSPREYVEFVALYSWLREENSQMKPLPLAFNVLRAITKENSIHPALIRISEDALDFVHRVGEANLSLPDVISLSVIYLSTSRITVEQGGNDLYPIRIGNDGIRFGSTMASWSYIAHHSLHTLGVWFEEEATKKLGNGHWFAAPDSLKKVMRASERLSDIS